MFSVLIISEKESKLMAREHRFQRSFKKNSSKKISHEEGECSSDEIVEIKSQSPQRVPPKDKPTWQKLEQKSTPLFKIRQNATSNPPPQQPNPWRGRIQQTPGGQRPPQTYGPPRTQNYQNRH